MVDGSSTIPGLETVESRLEALKEYNEAWRKLQPSHRSSHSVNRNVVGFANGMVVTEVTEVNNSKRLHFDEPVMAAASGGVSLSKSRISRIKLSNRISRQYQYAIDPSQDLLVWTELAAT